MELELSLLKRTFVYPVSRILSPLNEGRMRLIRYELFLNFPEEKKSSRCGLWNDA